MSFKMSEINRMQNVCGYLKTHNTYGISTYLEGSESRKEFPGRSWHQIISTNFNNEVSLSTKTINNRSHDHI